MDLNVQPDGQSALATADVARGWRQLAHTFGFCEEARLDLPQDKILRVQAAIRAWPNWRGRRLYHYPPNVFGLLTPDWGRVELREEDLRISMDLATIRPKRLRHSGLVGVYQEPIELERTGGIGFWFSVLVILLNAGRVEYPDIIEWDTQFYMGGLPR